MLSELLRQVGRPGPMPLSERALGWIGFAILAIVILLLASSGTEEDEVL